MSHVSVCPEEYSHINEQDRSFVYLGWVSDHADRNRKIHQACNGCPVFLQVGCSVTPRNEGDVCTGVIALFPAQTGLLSVLPIKSNAYQKTLPCCTAQAPMPTSWMQVHEQRSGCNPVLPQLFDFSRRARLSEKTPYAYRCQAT
jgi:hypothetical protein